MSRLDREDAEMEERASALTRELSSMTRTSASRTTTSQATACSYEIRTAMIWITRTGADPV